MGFLGAETRISVGGGNFQPLFLSLVEVLSVPPLFLQESGHSGGMKFSREAC